MAIVQQRGHLKDLETRIQDYSMTNTNVRMGNFKEELLNLQSQLTAEQDR